MNIDNALAAFAALSHGTRLGALRLLIKAGPSGLPAGEIATELGVVQNTMSTHLAVLTRSGLIQRTREGRSILYSAEYECIRELLIYLLKDCCQGDDLICAPIFEAVACGC